MAMTKKEQQYVADLEKRLRVLGALRWTTKVEHDVEIPKGFEETSGWIYNDHSLRVEPAWSSCISHGIGHFSRKSGYTESQNGIRLYSSKLLALKAMRCAVENKSAEKIAEIDMMIADEESS